MKISDIPNIISVLRLVAVIPIVYLLVVGEFAWALALFAAAGISDGIDGFLAKQFGWRSQLGGILDPVADKALMVCCFLVLGVLGLIPLWLVLTAIFRDLVIVGGAILYHFRVAELEAAPLPVSKLNTAVQIILVVVVLWDAGVTEIPSWLVATLGWFCLGTLVVSGLQYVWVWGRKAVAIGWKDDEGGGADRTRGRR